MMGLLPRRGHVWSGWVKTYRGIREPLCHVRVLEGAGATPLFAPLPHSPAALAPRAAPSAAERELAVPRELVSQALVAFDWGADGPGTHYLAVALLADLLGAADRGGIKATLPFMRRFLSRLPKDDFEIADTVLRAFLHAVTPAPATVQRALPGGAAAADGTSPGAERHDARMENGG
jgi:hypothetical protein